MQIKRHIRVAVAAIFLFVLVASLASCSETNTDKDTLNIAFPDPISVLEAGQEGAVAQYYIQQLINEGLVALNEDGKISPALAESWENEDLTVWTFKLRTDAKFSDGSDVTIDDIIYSINRSADPEQQPSIAYFWPEGFEVEAVDASTLKITLPQAQSNFLWSVSNNGGLFVTKESWVESVDAPGSEKDTLLGSGPYKVEEFKSGASVTLTQQDYWWGDKADIKTVKIDFITDDQARLLAFKQGDVDFIYNIPTTLLGDYQAVEGASVSTFSNRSYKGLTFDLSVKPFDNVHVRRAVAYAIDAESIIDSVLDGYGELATTFTAPEQFATVLSIDQARARLLDVTHYEYNIDKAKEEFALSGVEPFSTTIYYPASMSELAKASLFIADNLKEIGITTDIKEITLENWLNEMGNGTKGIDWMDYGPPTLDPAEIAVWFTDTSGEGANPANWLDPTVTPYWEGFMSKSPLEGLDDLIKAHDIAGEQAIYAPLWWGVGAVAVSEKIEADNFDSVTFLSQNWVKNFSIVK
jgi:peptide/nickel transport system substrate-binding protein